MVLLDFPQKIHEHPAFCHPPFTPQQALGLNAVRTLVYRRDLAVPDKLLNRMFFNDLHPLAFFSEK